VSREASCRRLTLRSRRDPEAATPASQGQAGSLSHGLPPRRPVLSCFSSPGPGESLYDPTAERRSLPQCYSRCGGGWHTVAGIRRITPRGRRRSAPMRRANERQRRVASWRAGVSHTADGYRPPCGLQRWQSAQEATRQPTWRVASRGGQSGQASLHGFQQHGRVARYSGLAGRIPQGEPRADPRRSAPLRAGPPGYSGELANWRRFPPGAFTDALRRPPPSLGSAAAAPNPLANWRSAPRPSCWQALPTPPEPPCSAPLMRCHTRSPRPARPGPVLALRPR
jgi:hypothetical protein